MRSLTEGLSVPICAVGTQEQMTRKAPSTPVPQRLRGGAGDEGGLRVLAGLWRLPLRPLPAPSGTSRQRPHPPSDGNNGMDVSRAVLGVSSGVRRPSQRCLAGDKCVRVNGDGRSHI